jgi:hypothetical protein
MLVIEHDRAKSTEDGELVGMPIGRNEAVNSKNEMRAPA